MIDILLLLRSKKPILITLRGQSNIVGSGGRVSELPIHLQGEQSNRYVFVDSANEFQLMNVGVNHHDNSLVLVGPEASLMYELSLRTSKNIHYVKYARGSTSLFPSGGDDWNLDSTGELWDQSQTVIDKAIVQMNNLYGVGRWIYLAALWHQGEADQSRSINDYETQELRLINNERNKYGNQLIWISGGLRESDGSGGETVISSNPNTAKQNNANKNIRNYYFSNNDFTLYDTVHYDTDSQILHGQRYANILLGKY